MSYHIVKQYPFDPNITMAQGATIHGVIFEQGMLRLIVEESATAPLTVRYFNIQNTGDNFIIDDNTMTAPPDYVGSAVYGNVAQHVFEVHPAPGFTPWGSGGSIFETNESGEAP